MVIQWTTPATEELVSAYEYAAAENPAAARRITNHIWETVEVLARHPMAGRKWRIAGRREFGHSRHTVYRRLPYREERSLDPCGDARGEKVAWRILMVRVAHALDSRIEIKLVRKKGTKPGRQRKGGGKVKTRGI